MASRRQYTTEEVLDYLQEKQHYFGLDQGDDFGDFGLDESDSEDEEEFDGLAAYRGDPTVSEFAYCDNSDSENNWILSPVVIVLKALTVAAMSLMMKAQVYLSNGNVELYGQLP